MPPVPLACPGFRLPVGLAGCRVIVPASALASVVPRGLIALALVHHFAEAGDFVLRRLFHVGRFGVFLSARRVGAAAALLLFLALLVGLRGLSPGFVHVEGGEYPPCGLVALGVVRLLRALLSVPVPLGQALAVGVVAQGFLLLAGHTGAVVEGRGGMASAFGLALVLGFLLGAWRSGFEATGQASFFGFPCLHLLLGDCAGGVGQVGAERCADGGAARLRRRRLRRPGAGGFRA